jgi:hypothetical protein
MRVFGLLLFVYGVNYAPVHLALEPHWGDLPAHVFSAVTRAPSLVADDHEDASHHTPHLASDHSLRMASQAQVSFVSSGVCVASTSVEIYRPQPYLPLFLTERQNPPGIPPPDPLQPRAPPFA